MSLPCPHRYFFSTRIRSNMSDHITPGSKPSNDSRFLRVKAKGRQRPAGLDTSHRPCHCLRPLLFHSRPPGPTVLTHRHTCLRASVPAFPPLSPMPRELQSGCLPFFKSAQTSPALEACPLTLWLAPSPGTFKPPTLPHFPPQYLSSSNVIAFTCFLVLFIVHLLSWNLSSTRPGIFVYFLCWCLEQCPTLNRHTVHTRGFTDDLLPGHARGFIDDLLPCTCG